MNGDKPLAFVLMPFAEGMKSIYTDLIMAALVAQGYEVRRADDLGTQQNIMRDVIASLERASLVVADLTGRNPNVMYEVALAHGLRRPTILIAQRTEDIPFDLQGYRTIVYDVAEPSSLLSPLGDIARRHAVGDVLFGNPLTDFGSREPPPLPASDLRRLGARARETGSAMTVSLDALMQSDHALGKRLGEFHETLARMGEDEVHALCRDMDDYAAHQRAELRTYLKATTDYYAAVEALARGVDVRVAWERESLNRLAAELRVTLTQEPGFQEALRVWRDQHLELRGIHERLDRTVETVRNVHDEELIAVAVNTFLATATLRLIEARLDA